MLIKASWVILGGGLLFKEFFRPKVEGGFSEDVTNIQICNHMVISPGEGATNGA